MATRTRIELGRREDLGADCANCFGLCCVALAFARPADFPFDKLAGDPCENLDTDDPCRIHPHLRDRGFKGCTVTRASPTGRFTTMARLPPLLRRSMGYVSVILCATA